MKKALALGLVFVMAMTAVFAIPASANGVVKYFSAPACGCGGSFLGEYCCGNDDNMAYALTTVSHSCGSTTAYTSLKTWIYSSSYNNYTSRTITATDSDSVTSIAQCRADYSYEVYYVRAAESYHRVTVVCDGEEYTRQAWESSGDVPLSVTIPVDTY